MKSSPGLSVSDLRPGYLAEVTLALLQIREMRSSGRLSIRNGERFGLAHLYFKEASLIHVIGDKKDGESILNDLLSWSKGSVRFDPALLVSYESITWQQAQIFARWLAFLEMRGTMLGIPRTRLDGFVHDLIEHLPGEPIAFPQQIANYEENLARQRPRLGEDIQHLIERTVPEETRQQLQQISKRVGDISYDLARRAAQGLRQIGEVTSEAAKQGIVHADEVMRNTFERERRQQVVQPAERTIEPAERVLSQKADATLDQQVSSGTQAVRVRSIRPALPVVDNPPGGR